MRMRCSTSISRRGSSAPRHPGIGAGIDGVTRPCWVRIPISALTTDFVMEKPSSGVSTPMPAAYRSAMTLPSCSTTTALVLRNGGAGGSSKARSSAVFNAGSAGSTTAGPAISGSDGGVFAFSASTSLFRT